jgi:nicotinamidase/pyrazinamidase
MNAGNLFWNVDTQFDFIEPSGKLYVKGAEKLKPVLKKITEFAAENKIRVINTCDFHLINSNELSQNPDFIATFPDHCMAGTRGAEFIDETRPVLPAIVDWMTHLAILPQLANANQYRNIVIRKDAFDAFEGNPYTTKIVNLIAPEKVFVYGVSTNVCVDKAVCGLAQMGYKVFVFEDAIKELPGIPVPFKHWKELGIKMIQFGSVKKYI